MLVAKQPRKPAQAKPITAHQLFPAVVALWFGALFGLGSLAVRPSLLESLVIQSRIDLLVPAASPPLGVTARILVALVLAAIGSALGIAIARRIARPKTEVRERKRNALATDPAEFQPRYRTAYAEASTNTPLSIGEAADADAGPDTGVLAQRRRALTVDHDERDFVPYETAPLPGGAPQILDISRVGMAGVSEVAPLELVAMAAETLEMPAQQVFEAVSDDRQVFGVNPQPAMSDAAKQIFGQVVDGDRVSEEFVKAAGFQTSVFRSPEPSPLFAPRDASAQQEPAPGAATPEAPSVPQFEVPPSAQQAAPVAEPVAESVAAPQPITADLGMTDLAGRLAESMARRRAARSIKIEPTSLAQEPAAVSSEPAPVVEAVIPQAFEAPAAIPPLLSVFEAPPLVASIPQAFEPAPVETPAQAAFEPEPVAAAPAIPQAMRPLDLDGFEEDDDHLSSLLPPRHMTMSATIEPMVVEPAPQPAVEVEVPEPAEAEVAEANYASLLGVAPNFAASPGFVRIDEPEAEVAAIEPVVIFPGQMVRQPEAADESAGFRRFDAPTTAGQGAPIAANQSAPEVDVAESERALRMALANLQRMSGAA